MARTASSPILRVIRQVAVDPGVREASDRDLLQRFSDERDPAAFQALVRRHGAMVFDVCRGVLGNEASAEDAFQATFLILARKAASIRKGASLASWLHSVACRAALQARAREATRKKSEAQAPARAVSAPDDLSWREVRAALHEELNKLPERYRAALVMCYLEGQTQDQAAAQLRLGKTTLKDRLERGRKLLRTRLVGRGLGPAALLVLAAWPAPIVSASLPSTLLSATVNAAANATVNAAGLSAAGQATAGVISANVAAVAEGVIRTMFVTKLKTAIAFVVIIALVGGGVTGAVMPGAPTVARRQVEANADDPDKPMSPSRSLKGEFKFWSVSFGRGGKALATVSAGAGSEPGDAEGKNAVRLWDVQSGNVERTLAEDLNKERAYTTFAGVGLSADGKTVAAPAGDNIDGKVGNWLFLWDAETGQLRHKLKHFLEVRALAFSPDSKLVASGTGGNTDGDFETVKLWDVQSGELLRTLKTTNKEAGKVAFAPHSKLLAAVLYQGDPLAPAEVVLWDPARENSLRTLPDSAGIEAIAFSPDGKTVLGASRAKLRRWEASTGKVIEGPDLKWDFEDESWSAYAFSPDGKTLAVTGRQDDKHVIALYDVKTAKRMKTLAGHAGFIASLSFAPDGATLASAGLEDGTIHLWDFDGGTDLQRKVNELIEQLDADHFQKREQAASELKALGRSIVPQLEAAVQRPKSPEARRRLEQLLAPYRVRTQTDLEKLQGIWILVEAGVQGKQAAARDLPTKDIAWKPHQLAIAGRKIARLTPENVVIARGVFELDPARKPKEMTINWLIQWPTIYKLEGDTLTICFHENANLPRPGAFRTLADSDLILLVYQRAR